MSLNPTQELPHSARGTMTTEGLIRQRSECCGPHQSPRSRSTKTIIHLRFQQSPRNMNQLVENFFLKEKYLKSSLEGFEDCGDFAKPEDFED